jgi:acetolactate synthase-1/2/3 large subunit
MAAGPVASDFGFRARRHERDVFFEHPDPDESEACGSPACLEALPPALIRAAMTRMEGHGGDLIAATLKANGVDHLFTLSGGHIFPIYDGAHRLGMKIVDTRHEQQAAFAAEAHGKLSRSVGVAALTAGPGVTNGMSSITSAFFNGSPMLVLGGRAPELRWGQGSLQEMDHLPLVRTVTKRAETVFDTAQIAKVTDEALWAAGSAHRGPVFVDFPMDVLFSRAEVEPPPVRAVTLAARTGGDIEGARSVVAAAERPVLLIGSDVWMNRAETYVREFVERARIPAFMNGMGRGVLPADHPLALSAARGYAFGRADVVIVVGTPLDFRLGFGKFGDAQVVHIADHKSVLAHHVEGAHGVWTNAFWFALDHVVGDRAANEDWLDEIRKIEAEKREGFEAELHDGRAPLHPARVYGELIPRLKRDAIVICDGGDFASYAGRFVDVYEPGGWLDPGPYGCLGTAPGYALAAGLLHPGRQIVVMLGDGAAGFGMGDWDTLVRFGINVTLICGNNGIWGLEKHPMQFLYGYDVAAELRPEIGYHDVMTALGGHGELVRTPDELGPALERAFATLGPSLVNVLTDPSVAYPRSSNLG